METTCLMGLLARGWPVVRQMAVERMIQATAGEGAGEGVERDGEGRDAAVAHPVGGEGDQRKAEEEGEVGPEDAVGDVVEVVGEVVVVDPVDAGLDEAEEIDEEEGEDGAEAVGV